MMRKLGAIKEFRRFAMARGNIYFLLSNTFISNPSYKIVTNFLKKDFLFSIAHVLDDDRGVKLLIRFAKVFRHDKSGYKALTREYRDLFVNLGFRYVNPYESAYREDVVIDDLKNLYKWAGVDISRLKNPLDHFGLELWFMYYVCYAESKAWTRRDKELAIRCIETGKSFLERHLMRWTDELCNRINRLSKSDFYRGVAEITKGYIKQDYREVKELLKEVEDL